MHIGVYICALVVDMAAQGKLGANQDKRDINFKWHCRAEQGTKFRHQIPQ